MRNNTRHHQVILAFETKEEALFWADLHLPEGTALYHGDAMDKEFSGAVPSNTYVVRREGAKPDGFRAERPAIGAEEEHGHVEMTEEGLQHAERQQMGLTS